MKKKNFLLFFVLGLVAADVMAQGTIPRPSKQPTIGASTYTPAVRTYTANGVSFRMIEVEGGTFRMGATAEQGNDAYGDEKTVHSVALSTYYIGQTEVKQALWEAVMGSNPSHIKGDDLPVEQVSWEDCQKFIAKLNRLTGKHFRLPTEAEWEYAARGGSKSRGYKYSGSDNIGAVAWYEDNNSDRTHAVASHKPNELGLYDMSGNVWEWCQDWYGDYGSATQHDPTGPNRGTGRVFRGGCWINNARGCRVSNRNNSPSTYRDNGLGFRLVLVP